MEEQNKNENQEPIWQPNKSNTRKIFLVVIIAFFLILLTFFLSVSLIASSNDKIVSGIYIKNINVSGYTREQAMEEVNAKLKDYMDDSIVLKHRDYTTEVSLEQLEASFDVEAAVNAAYNYGRTKNIFKDSFQILSVMVSNINIDPVLNIKDEELKKKLEDISTQLPDTLVQNSYYIEGSDLIVTRGKKGYIVDTNMMYKKLKAEIQKIGFIGKTYELDVIEKEPEEINLDKIHDEICKAPVNASCTMEPYSFTPSESGVDFDVDLEYAKTFIKEHVDDDEFAIQLKVIEPEVTNNMLPVEVFPDLLSEFSTNYDERIAGRTNNLKLAAAKINGTVLMPDEVFSYNTVVGKRTIETGYQSAKIYVSGQVVDGIGGGICQVSTTLYNAALYANLEIVERSNHQFVPSYVGAGLDATVVYGAIDFKIKNTRKYPIKIICSVEDGICNFKLYGHREETEYEISVDANVLSRSSSYIKSKTYRTFWLNGEAVNQELVSSDTYMVH